MSQPPEPIELVVLDMAGTTVQEHQAVYEALRWAVTNAGGQPSFTDIQAWMGAGKREAIAAMLADANGAQPSSAVVDEAFGQFRRRLEELYWTEPPVPIDGVPEAFSTLRAEGVKVALTTGFDRQVTRGLLATLGWDDTVIDAVICVDDVRAGRPAPYMIFRAMEVADVGDVRRVLTAGDTTRDLEAGTNAGAAMVLGVLTGAMDESALSKGPHTHLVDGVADIPALLASRRQPIRA